MFFKGHLLSCLYHWIWICIIAQGGHSFSTYLQFSEKKIFLTPWCVSELRSFFSENFADVLNRSSPKGCCFVEIERDTLEFTFKSCRVREYGWPFQTYIIELFRENSERILAFSCFRNKPNHKWFIGAKMRVITKKQLHSQHKKFFH